MKISVSNSIESRPPQCFHLLACGSVLSSVHAEEGMILHFHVLPTTFGINRSFDPAVVKNRYPFSLIEGFEHFVHFVSQVKNSSFHGNLLFLYSQSIHFSPFGQWFSDLIGVSRSVNRLEAG